MPSWIPGCIMAGFPPIIHEEPDAAKRDQNKYNGRLLMAVAFLSLAVGLGLVVWGLTWG